MKKIALLLVFLLVLTGCGAKEESPEQAVTNALNAVKNLDKGAAQKYFTYDKLFSSSDGSEQKVLDNQDNVKLIVKNLKFKVISSSINGNR